MSRISAGVSLAFVLLVFTTDSKVEAHRRDDVSELNRKIGEWVISYPGGEILLVGHGSNTIVSWHSGLPDGDFEIRSITIRDCGEEVRKLSPERLQQIKNLTSLTDLSIANRYLPTDALEIICQMSNLESLWYNGPLESLKCFETLDKLEFLDISGSELKDGLSGIEKLESLETFRAVDGDIGDTDVVLLEKAKLLMTLNLSGTHITDDGLKAIASLPMLHYLTIRNTQISDAGLRHLHHHPTLRNVFAKNTKVSPESAVILQQSLGRGANVRIDR